MCTLLRHNLKISPKQFISSRTSSLKFFSALSTVDDKYNRNLSGPIIENVKSFYEFVHSSDASKITKQILIDTHDFTGLPWCTTIIAASLALKLGISLPCGIFQQYNMTKLELTKIQFDGMIPSIKQNVLEKGVKEKWPKQKFQVEFLREIRKKWKGLVVENNCHPLKPTVLFFVQFPLWLLLTLNIRTLSSNTNKLDDLATVLQMQVGGPFWCKNLTWPDPTLILPTVNFLALLAINEISFVPTKNKKLPQSITTLILTKAVPIFLRLFAVFIFFISAISPSGLSLFWASNSVIGLLINLSLKSPRVRRFLRIPKTPSECDTPYKEAWSSISGKWKTLFSVKK